MNYLLDTHILVWFFNDSSDLSLEKKRLIENKANQIFISSISTWEIEIKALYKSLDFPRNLDHLIQQKLFIELPVKISHTKHHCKLPLIHKDPFDRMLICQTIEEGLTLITDDKNIKRYKAHLPELKIV